MKASIAVATVSGKAYYLIVNELQKRSVPFLSLTPQEPVPVEVKVVLTTEKEKHLIEHEKILVYNEDTDVEAMINNALQTIQGRENCEKLVIGIDPGETQGLAVLADGKVIRTEMCSSMAEILEKVKNIINNFEHVPIASISVKVGDGVPSYKQELLQALDNALPQSIILESVSETGTSRYQNETKNRRGLRDIVSAIRIAGRSGHTFQRRRPNEENS
jgi:activator of 2-hydroxyglutaryl-CoA dehydratase